MASRLEEQFTFRVWDHQGIPQTSGFISNVALLSHSRTLQPDKGHEGVDPQTAGELSSYLTA